MNHETKNPSASSGQVCQNCSKDFVIESEDFDFYKKMDVPPPTRCPECRMQRRMCFRNDHQLFRNVDAVTKEEIFSSFPRSAPIQVYDHPRWWSDSWDPLSFGEECDLSRPFFAQFREFIKKVPRASRSILRLSNSDYCDQSGDLKNCYLCFNGGRGENSLYGVTFMDVKDSVDFFQSGKLELCSEVSLVASCYKTFFSYDCEGCQNSAFLVRCDDCSDCFGCVNLLHKKYYIFNKPYTKEEYEREIKKFDLGSYEVVRKMKERMMSMDKQFPEKFFHGSQNENVIGEYVYNSKNAKYCYEAIGVENVKYSQSILAGTSESYDFTNWGDSTELIYECVTCGNESNRLKFCIECWPGCNELEYCIECHSSSNCFASIGLRIAQYCIFNKQYSKEEYQKKVSLLKKHMKEMPYVDARGKSYGYGEFFPPEFSPYAYNETMALDLLPLAKEEALKTGFGWQDPNLRDFEITVRAEELSDHISDTSDEILKEVIGCASCKRAYQIASAELGFYKRFNLALPRSCFPCRHSARTAKRNPPRWQKGFCMCEGGESGKYKNNTIHSHGSKRCENSFETTFSNEKEAIVYCESCFLAETR